VIPNFPLRTHLPAHSLSSPCPQSPAGSQVHSTFSKTSRPPGCSVVGFQMLAWLAYPALPWKSLEPGYEH
jgi:hypothetical protein